MISQQLKNVFIMLLPIDVCVQISIHIIVMEFVPNIQKKNYKKWKKLN
jgi:hypothetical protein